MIYVIWSKSLKYYYSEWSRVWYHPSQSLAIVQCYQLNKEYQELKENPPDIWIGKDIDPEWQVIALDDDNLPHNTER